MEKLTRPFAKPSEALFKAVVAKSHTCLFADAEQLAETLAAYPSLKTKKLKDIRMDLNGILQGYLALTDEYREPLFLAIKRRFDDELYDYGSFEKLLSEKFTAIHKPNRQPKRTPRKATDPPLTKIVKRVVTRAEKLEELLEKNKDAGKILVITAEPLGLHNFYHPHPLRDRFLASIGLGQGEAPSDCSYTILIPKKSALTARLEARTLWETMSDHAVLKMDLSIRQTKDLLRQANTSGKIIICSCELIFDWQPLIFFDYDGDIAGYFLSSNSYRHDAPLDIVQLKDQTLSGWKNYLAKNLAGFIENNEIKFEDPVQV